MLNEVDIIATTPYQGVSTSACAQEKRYLHIMNDVCIETKFVCVKKM